ncbi:EPIDERMAL PATTERNING FACTOR-like protein 8 [Henckelia pumila]|uniref:EPIDERMAL PATTERNING FACTOR-like protein 8 n=1 Tax=Henckelia pumila TaxID=405737 RepID=UPI003C6E535E
MAALSSNYHLSLSLSLLVIFFFFSLTLLPSISGAGGINGLMDEKSKNVDEQMKKTILGSRPPACSVDKCMNCRPCEATLVIPPHRNNDNKNKNKNKNMEAKLSRSREDDSYYLLSWKCRCGDKFFQP